MSTSMLVSGRVYCSVFSSVPALSVTMYYPAALPSQRVKPYDAYSKGRNALIQYRTHFDNSSFIFHYFFSLQQNNNFTFHTFYDIIITPLLPFLFEGGAIRGANKT